MLNYFLKKGEINTKTLKIALFPSFLLMAIMFCFLFVGCGGKPALQKETGTLNDLATCETDVNYSYADVAKYFQDGNLAKFANADGFRFTYYSYQEIEGQNVVYTINGLTNSEGMMFQSFSSPEDSDYKVVCLKNGNIYTQTSSHGEQGVIQTFVYKEAGEENPLKTSLQSVGVEQNLITPQAIINLINSENCLISQKNSTIKIQVLGENPAIVYLNLNENNNLCAIKAVLPGKAQITLSAFDGIIEFPIFDHYEPEA